MSCRPETGLSQILVKFGKSGKNTGKSGKINDNLGKKTIFWENQGKNWKTKKKIIKLLK